MADLLNAGTAQVLAALTEYLAARAEAGTLAARRNGGEGAAGARDADLVRPAPVLRPGGAAIPAGLAADTAVDALVHALVPASPASASTGPARAR